ncbi:pellicle/biofilm biosynthesis outer membrane protein PelC [Silvimonas sp. JCM 19000]
MHTSSSYRGVWRRLAASVGAAALLGLSACAVTSTSGNSTPALPAAEKWAMLPLLNRTETPLAGLRAESIVEPLLVQHGLTQLQLYPSSLAKDSMLAADDRAAVDAARQWAQAQHIRYAVGGSVDEWRYKVGVDGEPAVGVSLMVWDLQTGQVVWSGVGGKSGYSREALSAVAQKLISKLIDDLPLARGTSAPAQ